MRNPVSGLECKLAGFSLLAYFLVLMTAGTIANAKDNRMVLEGLDGDVTTSAAAAEAAVDDTKGTPMSSPGSRSSRRTLPTAAVLGMLWGLSEFCLTLAKRSRSNATSKDRHSLGLIWLVNLTAITLGILAAYRLPSFRM